MTTMLVTGGTGRLGRPTVAALVAAGHDVRVLSRRTGPGLTTGNLLTGAGLPAALAGVDTVLHLATGRRDPDQARTLLAHARDAGTRHLVYMSIVGVDAIPLGYYRQKRAVEELIAASGLPYTIQRATQFHNLVAGLFRVQGGVPVLIVPAFSLQPIDVRDVAARLTELAPADAAGRVPDIGGPERRTARDFARIWSGAIGYRRAIAPMRLPGKTFAAVAAGHNLVPGPPYGRRTFAEFVAAGGTARR